MALDDAPSAGLTLRVSVEGTRAAGTSARSAVAAHHCSHNNDAATLLPGHRGRRRSDRLLPERARFLPDRSQIPAPSVLTESQQTSSGASRWEGLPCPRRGSPPSGTPSAGRYGEQGPALGSGRRARPRRSATSGRNSAPFAQPRPRARLFPLQLDPAPEGGREPNLTLCTVGRSCSSDSGLKGARALSRFLRLFASRFACYLHIWSELLFFPSRPALFFFHTNSLGP